MFFILFSLQHALTCQFKLQRRPPEASTMRPFQASIYEQNSKKLWSEYCVFLRFLPPAQIGRSLKRSPKWGQITLPTGGHLRPQVTSQSFENNSKHCVFQRFSAPSKNQHVANLGLKVTQFTPPTWSQFRPPLIALSFENNSKHSVFLHFSPPA